MPNINSNMEASFRLVANALDVLPADQAQDFLARLVLILANELNDADRFESAVLRAKTAAFREITA